MGIERPNRPVPVQSAAAFADRVPGTVTLEREIRSEQLLAGDRVLHIRHGDQVYTLRHTKQGKLLLTK